MRRTRISRRAWKTASLVLRFKSPAMYSRAMWERALCCGGPSRSPGAGGLGGRRRPRACPTGSRKCVYLAVSPSSLRILQGAQVLPQGRVQSPVEKGVKVLGSLSGLSLLQAADVFEPVFGAHGDRGITAAHQDEVHQQPRCAPVAIIERMNIYKAAVRVECGLRRMRSRPEPCSEIAYQRRNHCR
jgi:hypothetical protein